MYCELQYKAGELVTRRELTVVVRFDEWRLKIILEFLALLLLPFGGTAAEFALWLQKDQEREGLSK